MKAMFSPIKLEEVNKIREQNGQKEITDFVKINEDNYGLTADTERLIYLASRGLDKHEIAGAMNKTALWVKETFRKDIVKSKVSKYENKVLNTLIKRRIGNIADRAVDKLENLIDNKDTKDSVRLNAINSVLDRTLGRAEQKVSHEGNLIRQLYEEIKDERIKRETKIIDVTPEDIEDADVVKKPSVSQIDLWLSKNSQE